MFLAIWQAGGQTQKSPSSDNVNIVVILDISDRIDPSNEKHARKDQAQRDIKIVEHIIARFEDEFVMKHLEKLVLDLGPYLHRLTVAIPQQPKAPPIPSSITDHLTIKDSAHGGERTEFEKRKNLMIQAINALYQRKDNPFTGADIWSWFKNHARYALKKDGFHKLYHLSFGWLS